MNILYLSQYFHPEQFLNNHVAKALVLNGHTVDVVCCVPNYPAGRFFDGYSNGHKKEEYWNGVSIHRVFTIPRGKTAVQLVLNYLTYPLAAIWKLFRIGDSRGEISFVSMPSPLFQAIPGIFAKKVWGIPTVYWVQDIWPESAIITLRLRNRLAIRSLDAICGYIYRQADLVMVQSDGFHEKIVRSGVPAHRVVTLPNCAPETFKPVDPAEVPDRIRGLIPAGRRVVMFAGNIGESQDFDTIIDAAGRLPPDCAILIAVIGSGRDEDRVRALVASRGLADRFVFLGRHPEADMPLFFACADMMLVSLRDEPIFELTVPSKVQAYMACGKPILASLRGEGAAIVTKAGAGIVTPPSSAEELSRALLSAERLADAELREMGRRARHVYETEFSLQAIVDTLIHHLDRVLAQK